MEAGERGVWLKESCEFVKLRFNVPAFGEGSCHCHGAAHTARGFLLAAHARSVQLVKLSVIRFICRSCFMLFREAMMNCHQLTLWRAS